MKPYVRALTVFLLVVAMTNTGIAQAQEQPQTDIVSPAPSPTPADPLVQQLGNDSVFMSCRQKHLDAVKDQDGRQNPPDVFDQGSDLTNYFNCVYAKHDYKAVIIVGQALTSLERAHNGVRNYAYDSGGEFYWMALAYHKLGQDDKAKQYASLAYAQVPRVYRDSCFVDQVCHGVRILMQQLDKNAKARYAAEDHATSVRLTKEYEHEMAGVSQDMQDVMLKEGYADPCHKTIYNGGPNYQQVTWWFCDSNGHYRKAYTFLNGHLKSTFVP